MKKNIRKGDKNSVYHYLAPDQSEITLLTRNTDADGGDMAYCSLPIGKTSTAVCHKTIHELWYFTAGVGQYWIKKGDKEEVYSVQKGSVVSLPKGTNFQFRNTSSDEALEVVIVTMPPWPGEGEAIKVNGKWATEFQAEEQAAEANDSNVSASGTSAVESMDIFSGAAKVADFVPRLVQKPVSYDYLAPDMSEIRLLTRNTDASGGDMAHCTLPPGQTSTAVKHKSIHELWYITAGEGEIWLKDGEVETIHTVKKGSYVSIPLDASFQFRTTGSEPLEIVITTMPPWPGADEAILVNGKWPALMTSNEPDNTLKTTMQNKIDLPWLAAQGFIGQAKDLLQENEDVNQQSVGGRTALINAAAADKMDMISLLLEYNVDLNIQDNYGDTALMRAIVEGYTPIISLLLERGAKIDLQNKYGTTALMIAADNITASSENVYMQIASLLLQHGADPTLVNEKGKTALDLVFRSKKNEFQDLVDEYYHPTSFKMR